MKPWSWNSLNKPFFVLAPMADVTDVPFRSVVSACGRPDVFYTEFVSAHGLASAGRERLMLDLALTKDDHPIVAQFFGTKPEHIAAAATLARELGFDGVDINMGCPDRSIMKQGAGAALIKNPQLAVELIHALRDGAGDMPIAVKTRLGTYATEEMDAWLSAVLSAKPDVLVIHGRTVKEMSKVPAHWDLIGRAAVMAHDAGALCVGNGDVMSHAQGVALATQYGVDGLMAGRGIFHNPWLFNPSVDPASITPQQRLRLLLQHTDAWVAHWGDRKSFDLMKKFYKVYVSGWPGAAALRAQIMECRTPESVREIVNSHLDAPGGIIGA
jgi:tRNA-dihydrouridine synthase